MVETQMSRNTESESQQALPIFVRFPIAIVESMDYYIRDRGRFRSRGELINYAVQRYLEMLDEAERARFDVIQQDRGDRS